MSPSAVEMRCRYDSQQKPCPVSGIVHRSLWVDTAPAEPCPPLTADITTDVAIAGGGMFGITAAFLLADQGHEVTVVEARRIAEGVTGHTTGKVTAQHGLIYARLIEDLGHESARLHAQANQAAVDWVIDADGRLALECGLTKCPSYVYADSAESHQRVEAEVEACKAIGMSASLSSTELPFEAKGIRLDGQAAIHPRKYLLSLAERAQERGARFFEQSPVIKVEEGLLETDKAKVKARHVIVATNVPINDRLHYTPRMQPRRAYGVACRSDVRLKGMYISAGEPVRSLRTHGDMLIAVGENHPVGVETDTERHNDALHAFLTQYFAVGPPEYAWSTQDFWPQDGYPYVGRYSPGSKSTWTATGFQGWGLSMATAAALMISDAIDGKNNPWEELYDPFRAGRVVRDVTNKEFLKQQWGIASGFIKERLRSYEAKDLAPGDGQIAQFDGHKIAVHKDAHGRVHGRPAQCTHMGCFVQWNRGEQSWDCPCHGSRFSGDGDVLHGPATQPLRAREADDDAQKMVSNGASG